MKRSIDTIFDQWKESRVRQPLLVRGARQVGKTHSVEAFGGRAFENLVSVNFEERPELANCFTDFNPKAIIDRISILNRSDIKPGRTLLFLDEIQECPRAIMALRYFYEKMPRLHVIGAGSLVEFALRSEDFRMPVGRLQSVFMFPLSFEEFLEALGDRPLLDRVRAATVESGLEAVFHDRLESLLRQYLLVGGMPAAVQAFADQVPINEIQRLQAGLNRTFHDDFAKYASTASHKYLRDVFTTSPRMVGQRYKYSRVNPDVQSTFLKNALGLLCDARCLTRIRRVSGAGVPLAVRPDERRFKVACLDVGLMQTALGLRADVILERSVMQINSGAVAEQFGGQEILAHADPYAEPELFFWTRDARGSTAEVDYLVEIDGLVLPVEVKASARGALKSLRLFLQEYPESPLGIRYSMQPLSYHERILSIPLTMIGQTRRLVRDIVQG